MEKARCLRFPMLFAAMLVVSPTALAESCGELITFDSHDQTKMRVAVTVPKISKATLILLVGGSGYLRLDEQGCPDALKGNSLVRSLRLFHDAGFATALVDAPSDFQGTDGLESFRIDPRHAEDISKVIATMRSRAKAPVWVVGTSRGAISAANAASRLSGPSAPDGVILTSAVMSGTEGGRKAWTADTVFDLPLESIRVPVLVVGHADDKCARSPPQEMPRITARTNGSREQVVTVTGGPGGLGLSGLQACKGKSPHGFLDQEAEVASGMARFVAGGRY